MRDILKDIQENLDTVEEKYQVRILLAVESGSRGWGFVSPDSDYDVRFIYVHRPEEYLRVDVIRDTIEWKLDEVLDINGWDLRKALLAFGKGNSNIMEWANSPIVYRETEEWKMIRQTVFEYFSEKASLCHYYGIAKSTYEGFLKGDTVRYKKYFYALRPLLCCRWIEQYHTVPPMKFDELLKIFEDPAAKFPDGLEDSIRELLVRKAVTVEKDLNPQMPVIRDYIEEECVRQKELSNNTPDDRNNDYTELNEAFRKVLRGIETYGLKV